MKSVLLGAIDINHIYYLQSSITHKWWMPINILIQNKYVSREFQDYGYRLACEMGEETKKGMYIKMAKTTDRAVLERARSFVMDAPEVRNRGKLFMWAVGRIKKGKDLTGD